MILSELFKKDSALMYVRSDDNYLQAKAQINDRTVHFVGFKMPTGKGWAIGFSEVSSRAQGRPTKLTGSGKPEEVLSCVISFIRRLIRTKPVNALVFTADNNEPSRARIYERIISRYLKTDLPDWKMSVSDNPDKSARIFRITKEA